MLVPINLGKSVFFSHHALDRKDKRASKLRTQVFFSPLCLNLIFSCVLRTKCMALWVTALLSLPWLDLPCYVWVPSTSIKRWSPPAQISSGSSSLWWLTLVTSRPLMSPSPTTTTTTNPSLNPAVAQVSTY